MAKIWLHVFFITLATAFAEVLSWSYTKAIINPVAFLPYGLLYILFIDYIMKKKLSDWKTIYLFGILVGFITEAYFAKVMFFGWEGKATGFAPFEFFVLSFFVHPLFSFIIPLYFAKNFFNFPINIKESKSKNKVFWLLPIYPFLWSFGNFDYALFIDFFLSFFIFAFASFLLFKFGESKNIILQNKTRIILIILTLLFYIIGFFIFPEPSKIPPLAYLIFSFIFVCFIFILIIVRIKKLTSYQISYKPTFNLWKVLSSSFLFILISLFLSFWNPYLVIIMTSILAIALIIGAFIGTLYFLYIIYDSFNLVSKRSVSRIRLGYGRIGRDAD